MANEESTNPAYHEWQMRSLLPNYRFYNIHNAAHVAVRGNSANSASTHTMLKPFEIDADSKAPSRSNIIVTGDVREAHSIFLNLSRNAPEKYARHHHGLTYGDDWMLDSSRHVFAARATNGWILGADRDVEAYVLPFLDEVLTRNDLATVHAAALSRNGEGIVIGGWGGAGKTASLAALLKLNGTKFLSDDLTFISSSGKVHAFPKSMYIYPYHRDLYPHLFESPPKILLPSHLSNTAAHIRQRIRPIFEQSPRVEAFARKWTPEHMKVSPSDAFPGVEIGTEASLAKLFYLERFDGSSADLTAVGRAWAVPRLTSTLAAEYALRTREFVTLAAGSGVFPYDDWVARRRRIIDEGVASAATWNLRVPLSIGAQEVGGILLRHV